MPYYDFNNIWKEKNKTWFISEGIHMEFGVNVTSALFVTLPPLAMCFQDVGISAAEKLNFEVGYYAYLKTLIRLL